MSLWPLINVNICYYIYLYRYPNKESFVADAQLIFANCEYYNEDDSEVIGNCTLFMFIYNVFQW